MVSFILPGNSATGGYEVANSCRFNNDSSDYLTFTPSSNGSRRIFTISFWFKTTTVAGGNSYMFSTGNYSGGDGFLQIKLSNSGRLTVDDYDQSGDSYNLRWTTPTTVLFRDPGAWYHFVLAVDSTQGTQSNRAKVYINGVDISSSFTQTTSPSQNDDFHVNTSGQIQQIGRSQNNNSYYDGYLAEFVMIDGSALAPTSFGEFDEDTPTIWKPINVSGLTFGTNGFYLDFENSSSLGADVSGNGNNFTVNNLTSVDQSTDTCTNNFATMNVLDNQIQGATFSEGNLQVVTGASGYWSPSLSTIGVSQGKWYCEIELDATGGSGSIVGVLAKQVTANALMGDDANGLSYLLYDGQSRTGGTSSSFGDTLANGDVVGIALDLDNNKVYFSKNGTFQASGDPAGNSNGLAITAPASTDIGFYFIGVQDAGNGTPGTTYKVNFGSPPYSISSGNSDANGHGNFEYAVPSGYFALCTKNLAESG
tara:strand:- start:1059 stop:2495 length:1437 start_codon:yes stop_codon:yes gene_type:complete